MFQQDLSSINTAVVFSAEVTHQGVDPPWCLYQGGSTSCSKIPEGVRSPLLLAPIVYTTTRRTTAGAWFQVYSGQQKQKQMDQVEKEMRNQLEMVRALIRHFTNLAQIHNFSLFGEAMATSTSFLQMCAIFCLAYLRKKKPGYLVHHIFSCTGDISELRGLPDMHEVKSRQITYNFYMMVMGNQLYPCFGHAK